MSRRVSPVLLLLLASSPAVAVDAPVSAPPPPAAALTLLAEDNYPNNYLEGGVLKGMSVDLLKDAFRRAGGTYTMTVLPWARAYESALRDPGTCVFSTAHTPARETSFAWVGPLSTIEMTVVAPREHAPVVAGEADLRRYVVGTYLGDYREAVLKGMGVRVESVADDGLNAEKLRRGRIDLWATDSAKLPHLAADLVPVYTYYKVDLALACNPGTDPATLGRLRDALDAMRRDGTTDRLRGAYAPN